MVDPARDEEDRALGPGRRCLFVHLREDDDLDRALEVLEGGDAHRRVGLRHDPPEAGHDPADHDPLAVERLVLQVAAVGGHERADLRCDLAHRMLGEVQPEQLLLPAEALPDRDLGGERERPLQGCRVVGAEIEQGGLAAQPVACRGLAGVDRVIEAEQDLGGMTELVERPDLGERLEDLAVDEPEVDPRAQVGERLERAALGPRRHDRLDRALADVFHRQQPESDRRPLDRELDIRSVDIGQLDLDVHPAALGDRRSDLLLVRAEGRQDRGHVLDGVVGLEVRRLVGDQPVARGVGLVEPVALEWLERLEHRVDRVRLDPALRGLLDELLLLGPENR